MHLTTAHDHEQERDAAITWLRMKILGGRAGLDAHDRAVMVVEVNSPNQAWRLDLLGQTLSYQTWVRPDRSTCLRVRALLEADVRQLLMLDELGAPVLDDVPLQSRAAAAHTDILSFDVSRGRRGR